MGKRSRASIPKLHHLAFGEVRIVRAHRTSGRSNAPVLVCEDHDGRVRLLLLGKCYWNSDSPNASRLFEKLSGTRLEADEIGTEVLVSVRQENCPQNGL
jgi:hypothetical protein